MNISDNLSQQQLLEVLINIYNNEEKLAHLKARDLIMELKNQIISVVSKSC